MGLRQGSEKGQQGKYMGMADYFVVSHVCPYVAPQRRYLSDWITVIRGSTKPSGDLRWSELVVPPEVRGPVDETAVAR